MNDQTRKLLTEYLEECWHGWNAHAGQTSCLCGYEGYSVESWSRHQNRTFTTPDDMDALRRKMVEKEDWEEFCEWTSLEEAYNAESMSDEYAQWANWLMEPSRFCELAGEWIGRKRWK